MIWPALIDTSGLLAAAMYIDPIKLGAILAMFIVWAYFAQWVDKDTIAVNTYRELWNLLIVGLGTGGLALALLVPSFAIGFPVMAGLDLAGMVAYVLHRNSLVKAEDTVCTMAHFRRMQQEGIFSKKKKTKEVKERVRLTGADRKVVSVPEEETEREKYRLTQDLIFDTLWRRGAVVDVAPAGQAARVTYLIDGVLTEREGLPRADADALIAYVKQIAGLNPEERRKPQRGRVMAAIGENKYRIVVETAGSTAGERLRLRVVGLEGSGKLADLGFNPKQMELMRQIMERPRGLVLLSAPSGAGLTTTVYSMIRSHDAFLQNIQTLEYDKEVEVDNVTQRVYTPSDDKTFASDLQRVVRTDPDIVVLPDVREREAAALVCQASSEKIRMYVGLKAEDVFDALKKWTALAGDRGSVAKCLWLVANQRLVRRLCPECKQPYKPEPAMLKKLNMPPDAVLHRQPEPTFDKHGNPIICQSCQGTGYVGRIGVFDLLAVDDELRQVMKTASSISDVQTFALKRGGMGLQTQALQKVLDGTTSIQEVVRVLRGPASRAPAGAAGGAEAAAAPTPKPQPKPQGGRKTT